MNPYSLPDRNSCIHCGDLNATVPSQRKPQVSFCNEKIATCGNIATAKARIANDHNTARRLRLITTIRTFLIEVLSGAKTGHSANRSYWKMSENPRGDRGSRGTAAPKKETLCEVAAVSRSKH